MLLPANARLFFRKRSFASFSSLSSPFFFCNPKTSQTTPSFIRVVSSSSRKGKKDLSPQRRNSSTLREESKGREKLPAKDMEETETIGFNKKRAEGRDKGKIKTLQLKTRKLNPVNTISYVQILGTGMDTQDTSSSVLLFFDKQRFIFNAGEGLQRFCTEHKIKLSKIDHMFLTRVCSETAGGLPGLLLTLAGMGDEGMTVNIWGPSDLKYLVDAMRSFIPNAAMVHSHSFGSMPEASSIPPSDFDSHKFADPIVLVDDEVVKISAILLNPSCSNMSNLASSERPGEDTNQFLESLAPCSQSSPRKSGAMLKPGDISVIYACELPEIKGKFDTAKAVALGLKPGPKYRELQLGNSVMSDRQNVMVHPSDVLGPSSPGPIVLLVDCPTLSHLEDLLSIKSLNDYYTDSTDRHKDGKKFVNCVIHLGPSSVTITPTYQKWMKRFAGTQHIMAGHEMKNVEVPILKSSARLASRLNYLCPQLFPAPGYWSIGHLNSGSQNSPASSEDAQVLCESISAENLLKFHLRPYTQLGLDRSGIPSSVTSTEIITELLSEFPEIEDASKQVSQLWCSSERINKMAPPTSDKLAMVEEPWINEDTCITGTNMTNQGTHASKKDITYSNDSAAADVKLESDVPSCLENISREDMEIVLLGTGSSQPSKYRNVSSIYINLFSRGSLLLDCGEGTLAQLKRRFGVKGADDAVRSLRFIWISHIHADHHAGLARILSLRYELLRGMPHEPLLVIGPKQLKRFLGAYSRLEDLDMQFLDCRHTTEASLESYAGSIERNGESLNSASSVNVVSGNKSDGRVEGQGMLPPQNLETTLFAKSSRMKSYWERPGSPVDFLALKKLNNVLLEAGLETLVSVPVVHCPQAFGVVLEASERINSVGKAIPGWKLVYSGDTRPCQAMIDASQGATVLIHEATFEDGMAEEAIARNHSTTGEAVEVGASANAYRIILTHFSQRYPKIPVFSETHMQKTCIAFDMMSVNLADLPVLPKVLPYLTLLFRNEMVVDESDDIPVQMEEQ